MDDAVVNALVAGVVLAAAGVVLAAAGVALVAVGRLGRQGRLPRQHWSGIRTPSTMASDDAWMAAHRAGGPLIEVSGWSAAALGSGAALLCVADPHWSTALTMAAAGVVLLGATSGVIRGVRAARRE